MTNTHRSVSFLLILSCALALLTACQSSAPTGRRLLPRDTKKLGLYETSSGLRHLPALEPTQSLLATPTQSFMDTPTPSVTETPDESLTATPTQPPDEATRVVPNPQTEYVAQIAAQHAWVGFASTKKRAVAFVTDGTSDHQPTFAQWFRGDMEDDMFNANTPAKTGNDYIQAIVNGNTVTGTVTFAAGPSLAFAASLVPSTDPMAGLYRGERVINKQDYIAGWVVLPANGSEFQATPSPTIASATPSTSVIPRPGPAGEPDEGLILSPTPEQTTTPALTATPTTTAMQGGAIINTKSHTAQSVPALTPEDLRAKKIAIPNLATFKLVPCQQNLC